METTVTVAPTPEAKRKAYYVWHIPQIPGKAFIYDTDNYDEALRVVDLLADYDAFQFENNIKPDYSNASGVMQWDDEENDYVSFEEE